MKIVRWTGDQIPAVSCVDSTVQIKWQVTMVSREETMPVTSRWNGQIVLIVSTIRNGQSRQTDRTDRTGPDTISSCRKTMLTEERGQTPTRRASVPNSTFSSKTGLTDGMKFEVPGLKFCTLQPSACLTQKIGG